MMMTHLVGQCGFLLSRAHVFYTKRDVSIILLQPADEIQLPYKTQYFYLEGARAPDKRSDRVFTALILSF